MADAKGLQELISYFETGDIPTGAQFADLINSITKCINGTFDETDISEKGEVSITYPDSIVNGATVDTEIARPMYVYWYQAGNTQSHGPREVTKIDSKNATFVLGMQLPAGTYYYTLFYQN